MPSGWCMSGYHKDCADFYLKRSYSKGCVCACHDGSSGDAANNSTGEVLDSERLRSEDAVRGRRSVRKKGKI